jgi:hypothetical protein
MIYQLRYAFNFRPTLADVEAARDRWLRHSKPAPGVEVSAVAWNREEDAAGTRRAIRSGGYLGNAGVVKFYGAPDLTLCDYDKPDKPATGYHVARVARMLNAKPLWTRLDRTKNGWHMVIQWNREFAPLEVVALQAALGSDVKREAYNLGRVMSGKATDWKWNVLFLYKL